MYKSIDKHDCAYNIDEFPTNKELIIPLTLPNTTLNLSTVDQLKAVYEYVVAELSLVDPPNPFTNGLLRQSDQDIAKLIHEVISANLVSVGCSVLPSFSIPDYDNDTLVKVLIDQLNHSIAACNLGGDGGGSTSLLLIPTGAIESADGDYQRFAHDEVYAIEPAPGVFFKVWHAELESSARQAYYQVKVKMPVIDTASQDATVSFAAASITESGFFSLQGVNTVTLGFLKYQSSVGCRLRVLQGATVLSSVEITPTPIAGDEITLTLNADSVDYVHGANTGSLPVPNGFFSAIPNVLAFSGDMNPALIVPLSIKVAGA